MLVGARHLRMNSSPIGAARWVSLPQTRIHLRSVLQHLAHQGAKKLPAPGGPSPLTLHASDLFPGLRLNRRDRDGIDDVFGFAAARQIVAGTIKSLEDRADGGASGEAFGKFVGDVA
ncbi:hypothetical protein BH18ACI3_BH18ACI3_17560 [soil metagenome]